MRCRALVSKRAASGVAHRPRIGGVVGYFVGGRRTFDFGRAR